MNRIRYMAFVGMAAGLCALAACTQNPETGDQVAQVETPAAAPAPTPGPPAPPPPPPVDPRITAAIGVAQQWIAFIDQGQYAESWSATGQLFQANMQQQQWVQSLTGARTPLGTVVSREVAGSEIRTELPGAPPGQYALVSFATNFQNKPDIIETITMIDESGQWKVVGYSANPRAALEQQQAQPTPTPPQV